MGKLKRPVRIEGDLAYIMLANGMEAKIDASDADLLASWNWHVITPKRKDGSAYTNYGARSQRLEDGTKRMIYLHRAICGEPKGMTVDHVNGDGLDCRRENLRVCVTSENAMNRGRQSNNTSGLKGVTWHSQSKRWLAQIWKGGERHYLGVFNCKTAAFFAYAKANRLLHGEFGRIA